MIRSTNSKLKNRFDSDKCFPTSKNLYELPNLSFQINMDIFDKELNASVYLFNNDIYRDHHSTVPWVKESKICYDSYPHISVIVHHKSLRSYPKLKDLDGKRYFLTLYDAKDNKIYSFSDKLRYVRDPLLPAAAVSVHKLEAKLVNTKYALFEAGSFKQRITLPRQVRIVGKVTDFKNRPRKAYVRITAPYGYPAGVINAKTNDNGYFEVLGPEGIYHHAFICDGQYGRETLEFYAWNFPVEHPKTMLNARFDKIEIYRLAAAITPERTLLIHFVPMDIAHTIALLRDVYVNKGKVELKDLRGTKITTPLTKRDIEVYLDGEKLKIRTMRKTKYSLKDHGVNYLSNAYLVEAKIPSYMLRGQYKLRLVAHTTIKNIEEWGEAILFGLNVH